MVFVNPGDEILAAHINAKLDADGSNIKATTDFNPSTNSSYDLGNSTTPLKWRDIKLSRDAYVGNSIFLGLLSGDPGSPSEGQLWYNTTDKQFKGYNGTSVVILG